MRQTCHWRSPFVIVPCRSVHSLLLGFRCSEFWISSLRLLMMEILVFRVVLFLSYTSWSRVGSFRITRYCSFYSAFCGAKIGRFSSTRPKPVSLLSSMTIESQGEMIHFRSTRAKPVPLFSSMTNYPQVEVIRFSLTQARPVSLSFSLTKETSFPTLLG
jgi:hypothetical protein